MLTYKHVRDNKCSLENCVKGKGHWISEGGGDGQSGPDEVDHLADNLKMCGFLKHELKLFIDSMNPL